MVWLWISIFGLLFMFGFVVVLGAPYVPTLKKQQQIAIELLGLKSGQVFYDLGCGDGRLLMAAAQSGVNAVGYEINPLLAAIAWLRTRHCKGHVKVVWGNFWRANMSDADGVFVFLVDRHMKRLDSFLSQQLAGRAVKVASYGFKIPGRQPLAERGAMFLYGYGRLARRP